MIVDNRRHPDVKGLIRTSDSRVILKDIEVNIGDLYGGGIVFNTWSGGSHGMIAAINPNIAVKWGCKGTSIYCRHSEVGWGGYNTNVMTSQCIITSQVPHAGNYCQSLHVYYPAIANGYTDWFLPSYNELYLLIKQSVILGIPQYTAFFSSTEYVANIARGYEFTPGTNPWIYPRSLDKSLAWHSWPIRYF